MLIQNRLNQLELKTITSSAKYEAEKEARIATLLEAGSLKRATLQDELKALREKIKTRRMDCIEELSEAISIASSWKSKSQLRHPLWVRMVRLRKAMH